MKLIIIVKKRYFMMKYLFYLVFRLSSLNIDIYLTSVSVASIILVAGLALVIIG